MKKIIDIIPEEEQRRERILHAIKKVAQIRHALDQAIDELLKEVINEQSDVIG